jgi:hypothetical protein
LQKKRSNLIFVLGPPLVCYACTNCLYTNAVYQTCASGQTSCYVERNGALVTAGCANTCSSGANVQCCTQSYCNYPKYAAKQAAEIVKENN